MEPQDFGWALRRLKEGARVAREGWNGKSMFLFLGRECSTGFGEDEQSQKTAMALSGCKVTDSICMKTAQNTIVIGWLASQTDMLSDDWVLVEG